MKSIITLLTTALALTGCANLTGPDEQALKRAELAKRSLEVGSKVPEPSMRLSAN